MSFAITTPTITSISPTSGTAGTQVTISGSGFGASQGSGIAILGTSNAIIVNWSDSSIIALVASGSSSGAAQVIQNGIGSNALNFTISAPSVTNVSPTTGITGTQVTISGSGFGSTQGGGKVLIGTAYGVVSTWSDIQIVAAVAAGSSSGSVQVQQGGVWSNLTDFTVNTPTITNINPTTGGSGTQVTISGFYFGTTQGSGQVWLGNVYGSVVSWSDNQVVATVAPGALSGKAQILQNGVWSNSVGFATSTPQITQVSPASGTPGTNVTITGSGFGSSQGTGDVRLGTVSGQVVSWSDSQIVAAVASGAVTGIARVTQNGILSNTKRFVVPTVGSGNTASLVPYAINMLVGDTHPIQALDANNHPIVGLTWASSDTSIVTLSTDDPPTLTAVAPGNAVITAGDASADITVSSGSALPPGTVLWSVAGDGSGISQAIPAVPSPTGVADVFAMQASGSVQAITPDGTVAWTASVGSGARLLPDFQGGLVTATTDSVKRLDGITGQQVLAYNFVNPAPSGTIYRSTQHPVAIHPDGTIFVVDGNTVVGIDGQSGSTKFSFPLEQSTFNRSSQCQGSFSQTQMPSVGTPIIAGDGFFYLPYNYSESQDLETNVSSDPNKPLCIQQENDFNHLRLLRAGTDGSVLKMVMGDWSGYVNTNYAGSSFVRSEYPAPTGDFESLITNADKGVLFTWSINQQGACSYEVTNLVTGQSDSSGCFSDSFDIKLTDTSAGITSDTGTNIPAPVLQAQDGTFVGNSIDGNTFDSNLAGFNPDGSVKWTGPTNAQALYTLDDGSTIAQLDSGQFISFDQSGSANGQFDSPPIRSWTGAYQTASTSLDAVVRPDSTLASTWAAIRGPQSLIPAGFLENGITLSPSGSPSGSGAAAQQEWFPELNSCLGAQIPCPRESIWDALKALRLTLLGVCPNCKPLIFDKLGRDQRIFYRFISRQPRLFDGTRSNAPMKLLCGETAGFQGFLNWAFCPRGGDNSTVSNYLSSHPETGALSQTPVEPSKGILTFFRPGTICAAPGQTPAGVLNQATLFHEALHGFYGLYDEFLQSDLGIDSSLPTIYITYFLEDNILGGGASKCGN